MTTFGANVGEENQSQWQDGDDLGGTLEHEPRGLLDGSDLMGVGPTPYHGDFMDTVPGEIMTKQPPMAPFVRNRPAGARKWRARTFILTAAMQAVPLVSQRDGRQMVQVWVDATNPAGLVYISDQPSSFDVSMPNSVDMDSIAIQNASTPLSIPTEAPIYATVKAAGTFVIYVLELFN